jgi:hypothetical protein
MIINAKKIKTTMMTPSKSLVIRGSPSHRASKGSVTPKVTSKSGKIITSIETTSEIRMRI